MQHCTTPVRPPSMDLLCIHDEGGSLSATQDSSPSPSNVALTGVLYEDLVRDLVSLPSAPDSTTTLSSTESPSQVHKSTPSFLKMTLFRDKWLWETTCILFSTACVITMTILSSRLDGMWLSKWTFFLQPSTIFSILAAAAQSSMMVVVVQVLSQLKWLQMSLPKAQPLADFVTFDSASRGPLGSLSLFYLYNTESWVLAPIAYTASLLTIAALAIAPFTQQVISVKSDNLVPMDGINSTIAVSNHYKAQPTATDLELEIDRSEGGIGIVVANSDDLKTDPDLTRSFYNAYFNLGKSFMDFTCSSANCTWDTFNCLGLCSVCQDVTEAAQIIGAPGSDTILTPGGWVIENAGAQRHPILITNVSLQFGKSTLEALTANVVSTVVVQNTSDIPEQRYTITECSVDWCAKHYSDVVVVRPSGSPSLPFECELT